MSTWDDYRKTLADAAERFTKDTANHAMTVLHDDGLYRHLRFKRSDTGMYYFDLITWPGHLTVVGDLGTSYTFARIRDMFEFFRAASGWNHGSINPQYWAEKVVSGRDGIKQHSPEKFRATVADLVAQAVEGDPALAVVDDSYKGLAAEVEESLTDWYDDDYAEGAREFLDQFTYTYPGSDVFRFEDTWELDFTDWGRSYLWACNAIQWGIGVYDRVKCAGASGEIVVELPVGAVSA